MERVNLLGMPLCYSLLAGIKEMHGEHFESGTSVYILMFCTLAKGNQRITNSGGRVFIQDNVRGGTFLTFI